mmetsp:Transcript_25741/g.83137  ORF Transcript_25741/g.83137 Transcript_25741/m.83137 type:complete len:219 (-) Transcript_25741:467-1123(-)
MAADDKAKAAACTADGVAPLPVLVRALPICASAASGLPTSGIRAPARRKPWSSGAVGETDGWVLSILGVAGLMPSTKKTSSSPRKLSGLRACSSVLWCSFWQRLRKMLKMTMDRASLSALSPKTRSYSRGGAPTDFRIPRVATGSVEEMSEAKSIASENEKLWETTPPTASAYVMPPVTMIEKSVPTTAYSRMVPKLAKKERLRMVNPASKMMGGSRP